MTGIASARWVYDTSSDSALSSGTIGELKSFQITDLRRTFTQVTDLGIMNRVSLIVGMRCEELSEVPRNRSPDAVDSDPFSDRVRFNVMQLF